MKNNRKLILNKIVLITLFLPIILWSCSIVPEYKYKVSYKKCNSEKTITVTYTGSYLDTKPYYDEKNKILHLMWWWAFYNKDITPVWWIIDVCNTKIYPAEQVNDTLLHPDINATNL